MQRLKYIALTILFSIGVLYSYADSMRVYGYVVDSDNRGIEFAEVYIEETVSDASPIGTSTNRNGYYDLMIHDLDSFTVVFSMLGYQTVKQPVKVHDPAADLSKSMHNGAKQDVLNINVELATDEQVLEEVEVVGIRHQQGQMEHIQADVARVMPDATGGSIESILITFSGVNQNNELSSQYNVRGGSFDENEVYVNGIEVHRPILIRNGQQEGLSFVNPEMVDNVLFSAGGFDARYGDKMASVLDIRYKTPTKFESSLSLSLLGASAYVGHGDSVFSQMHGIRYKTSQYMLGGLNTQGNYKPNYVDYQTYLNWRVYKDKVHPWRMSFLGNFSLNDYQFVPDELSESFGGTTDSKTLNIWYEGQEKDRFITAFGALSAYGQINKEIELGFDLSGFYTNERETFDITGDYVLSSGGADVNSSINNGMSSPSGGESSGSTVLGTGTYHEHARNLLQAGVITLSHHGSWTRGRNELSWGISGQAELISDRISEWEWRDSAGYSMPNKEREMNLYYAMRGETDMTSGRLQAYIENTHNWQTTQCKVIFTIGGRLNWWSFTNEVLPSPRASLTLQPGWKRDVNFRIATGLYYQAPFYKEVRDTLTTEGVTRVTLNNKLKAPRSVHLVFGADYYFRAWGRPFKFTAEAYGKYMDRLVSYTVDNVRVRYSGKNDAIGYAAGLDLKLYGELVPGADSWINFGVMSARQKLLDHPEAGWLHSPNEQRYAFSMLFQDYFPKLPQLLFHIKFIWSDGLPFSAPRNILAQGRMSPYRRIDIGATWSFNRKTAKFMRAASAKHVKQWSLQLECFNLVGWNNVNGYFWATDADGNQWASPEYLTGRRINFKVRVDLQ